MDGFTHMDIFATKGIEYLLVIVFLVVFVFFLRALQDPKSGKHGGGEGSGRRAH